MAFKTTIKKLPNEPIIVLTPVWDLDAQPENPLLPNELLAFLNKLSEPVFQIADLSDAELNMDDLMIGATVMGRGETSPFHHPNLRQTVVVTRSAAVRATAMGMGYDVYGNLYIPVYENFEDALAYVRSQLA
ncbi:MAG TPA: hypothetical protein VHP83_08685 [Aggregatilineaceae bacterium]|nr:hypothetical protein [Aggregatilineaceae bacterium]